MKSLLIAVAVAATLSGCVVAPVPGYTTTYSEQYAYPAYESAYIWEPSLGVYYFNGYGGRRYYMDRGWGYRSHGVPHGYYHYHR